MCVCVCGGGDSYDRKVLIIYYRGGLHTSFGTPTSGSGYANSCPCGIFDDCQDATQKCNCAGGANFTDEGKHVNSAIIWVHQRVDFATKWSF